MRLREGENLYPGLAFAAWTNSFVQRCERSALAPLTSGKERLGPGGSQE
jgi:hypothetical protein